MELNDMQRKAIEVSKKLKEAFGNRITSTNVHDVVDAANHHSFKIDFLAYNYFSVVFQYELDIIGCHIVVGNDACISLIPEKHCYSDTNLDDYFAQVRKELESRIPDKYLKQMDGFKINRCYDSKKILGLFKELRDYLELHHDNSIINMLKLVKNTVNVLESDESEDFKSEYVLESYKTLYTGRAGLTEYYIWDNDYDTRMKLNEPLERIRDDLWGIMKPYV